MARTAESLQNVWQARFQEHTLNPFTSDLNLAYVINDTITRPAGGTIQLIQIAYA